MGQAPGPPSPRRREEARPVTSFMTFTKMTDRSVAASCLLGSTQLVSFIPAAQGTGLSAAFVGGPAALATLPVRERNERSERPTQAPAAVAVAQADAYAFAATGAGSLKQTTQHHTMWAFRGLEPWSDPA
ncbi:hypothetical protein [Streptomyces sp. NPDC101132]|uniref:hypothetical protein n=1 Tax=Streptomyces sp. NPDC101132 TaxID=3366110 RepID=UPI0038276F35